jgi:hypothetical protein
MKFVLIPILMLLVLAQAFSKWLVVAEYKMNKDFISRNLCVNKAKPKLHCNGKCQMMKRLAEEEKQNSSNNKNNSSKVSTHEVLFCDEITKPAVPLPSYIITAYNEDPFILKRDSPVSSIFHPPAIG